MRLSRSGIREIYDVARLLPDAIHLEIGEPGFATPAHIRAAAADAVEQGWTKYTPNGGIPDLRTALAKKLRQRNDIDADVNQVVVTPGAIAALYGTFLAIGEKQDEFLIPDPGWPNYVMICQLQDLKVTRYEIPVASSGLPEPELIEPLITPRTKALVLNSPSNPTGSVVGAARLEELIELASRHGLWVVSDEVYDEIVFDGTVSPSAAAVTDYERVISIFSFSKTYAMTGWRVGYAFGPAHLISLIEKLQEPITACVNAPAQMAALAAIEGPQDCVEEMRAVYRSRRDIATEMLAEAKIPHSFPGGAFYLWVDVSRSGLDGKLFAERLLTDHEVAVTPGGAFGATGERFVRVSLAPKTDDLIEGLRRLTASVLANAVDAPAQRGPRAL